jgi:hypothetical protein
MIADAVLLNESEKIPWSESGEGRATKIRIPGEVIARARAEVSKVASPSSGNSDLFANPVIVFEKSDRPPSLARHQGTHEAGGSSTENDDVPL